VARSRPGWTRATKTGLLVLLEQARQLGWTMRSTCQVLEVSELPIYRWLGRRAAGELADQAPGGGPMHGLLDWAVAEIVRLSAEWGEVDRSHRKLAHRGSYLERVWVSPASVRRVLEREGLRLRPLPRPGRSIRKPFPDWVEYRPGSIWIYDIERHEAPATERRCKTFSARLSQQPGEAGGSPTWETPGRAASSPDNDGTRRHDRTARVRLARREGVREEPAAERLSRADRQLQPGRCGLA
jgi:transposase